MSIGDILLERGKITLEQLDSALAARKSPYDRLDKIIVQMGFVNEREVLEVLGPRLHTFWKLAHDPRDLVVLETAVEEATRYLPMQGRKDSVRF